MCHTWGFSGSLRSTGTRMTECPGEHVTNARCTFWRKPFVLTPI